MSLHDTRHESDFFLLTVSVNSAYPTLQFHLDLGWVFFQLIEYPNGTLIECSSRTFTMFRRGIEYSRSDVMHHFCFARVVLMRLPDHPRAYSTLEHVRAGSSSGPIRFRRIGSLLSLNEPRGRRVRQDSSIDQLAMWLVAILLPYANI